MKTCSPASEWSTRLLYLLHNEVVGGILVSLRPSVRPSRIQCPLCSAYSSGWIHFRVRSTLKSAWILTLVLKSAWIWSEPWKLHKILEKCLNYSIPSLNFFSCQISEISHSVFCIVILYVEMSITLCFFVEFVFFWFPFNLVRRATG